MGGPSGDGNRPRHYPVVALGLARGLKIKHHLSRHTESYVSQAVPAIRIAQIGVVLDPISQAHYAINGDPRVKGQRYPGWIYCHVCVAAGSGAATVADHNRVVAGVRRLQVRQYKR